MAKVLIVDDDPDVLLAAKLLLKRHFQQVDIEKNPDRLPFLVGNGQYDAILLDLNFRRDVSSGKEGFAWLDRIRTIDPQAVVVLFTAYGDVDMAVRAMKAGATDFVLKPWENDKLIATLQRAVDGGRADRSTPKKQLDRAAAGAATLILAESTAMRQVLDTIDRVARTEANVLILGENGTGKDLVAREIHRQSLRRERPFVSVDLGALSESLFESELFGHVKGAFTDAREARAGRFEEAHTGTIFLDEIGNITLPQQARLLTVLQQRTVTRVGSNKPVPLDVRLICATNAPVHERAAERDGGRFRPDLLYRINTIEISLPPLRQRPDDILPLARLFLDQYRRQYNRPVTRIDPSLAQQWQHYGWPGNVRELQHTIERAVILSRGDALGPDDWPSASPVPPGPVPGDPLPLDEMEKRLIQQALQQHNGNITEVARTLGLSRQALYRRMEKYGL